MKKAIIALLILAVCGVLYLTFQGPAETIHLSEMVKEFVGYKGNLLQFRSDVHYFEYFIVGTVLAVLGLSMKWRAWIPGIIGCIFGLLDEVIKILLPTREFGSLDLIKDCIGTWTAISLVYAFNRVFKERKNP